MLPPTAERDGGKRRSCALLAATAEPASERSGERGAGGSGGVERRVVDRDIDACDAAGSDRGGEDGRELIGGQATGLAVVDCGHDRVVEHVRVDVDPEVVGGVGTGEVEEGVFGGGARAGRADGG